MDPTGLTARYDIDPNYAPEKQPPPGVEVPDTPADPNGPSIYTAVRATRTQARAAEGSRGSPDHRSHRAANRKLMKLGQFEFLKYVFRSRRQVYLDHNATTSVSPRVRHTMNRILKHHYGNPSSLYKIAGKSAGLIEQARHRVADAIHADLLEICFTGCATESNNAVLKSLSGYFLPKKKKIISTPIEHHSVINTLEYLKTQGITVEYCPVDRWGRVLLPELEKQLDEDTFLLCCVLANNETGVIQDIAAITRMAHQHDVLVLADCVQALGKIPVDVHEWGIDYASFSAHKLYARKASALYMSSKAARSRL